MANITIVGGGLLGLGTGLLLSQRGHEVTVLERDGDAPGGTTLSRRAVRLLPGWWL